MSAGAFTDAIYSTNLGLFFPISVQPETLTLTLNGVSNDQAAGPIQPGFPSARVSSGRRSLGVNARLVRVRFTGTLPPGYIMNGIITLPVLTQAVFESYTRQQTGTYTLEGTPYDIAFVGKTPETVR